MKGIGYFLAGLQAKKSNKIMKEKILRDFVEKMSKQEDIPNEFVEIVNKRFWELF